MYLIIGAILIAFVPFGQCMIISCYFYNNNWAVAGNAYGCESNAVNTENLAIIDEIRGSHLSGKLDADVEVFVGNDNKFQFIPTNLANFFPNLKGITFNSPLLRLSSNDLKPFSTLIGFDNWYGQFTSIDGDLFQNAKRIQRITIEYGKLQNVGENLLNGLNELRRAYFRGNSCISLYADNSQQISELKQNLLSQCPPLKCSLRCSLNEEFDELKLKVTKQDEKIAGQGQIIAELHKSNEELRDSNAELFDRLVELEKMMREIVIRP